MDITELKRRAPANVKWVDRYVDDREIAPVFEAADMCVLPYLEIDQSGVLATALAFRKPLLLSDVGGFPEVAGHGAAATVPAGDVAALRAELTALMFDSGRRSALATAGERLARDIWSWDTIAGLHLDLYARLGAGS